MKGWGQVVHLERLLGLHPGRGGCEPPSSSLLRVPEVICKCSVVSPGQHMSQEIKCLCWEW